MQGEEKDYWNIFSCTDDNYARHLGILMNSIKLNNLNSKITYWIISNDISSKNLNKLTSIQTENFKINILDFNQNLEFLSSTIKQNSKLSLSAYLRLFVTDYIPENIDSILYLDCDMICLGSLEDLFSIPFENTSVMGVKDPKSNENRTRLGIEKYVNSGMLYISLNKWRNENCKDMFLQYIRTNINNKNMIRYHDQDVINYTLNSEIKYIDPKWNSLTRGENTDRWQYLNELAKNGVIIHLIGKPWIEGETNPFTPCYEQYLRSSPWKDEPLKCQKRRGSKTWKTYTFIEDLADKHTKNRFLWKIWFKVYEYGYKHDIDDKILKMFDISYIHGSVSKSTVAKIKKYADEGSTLAMIRLGRAYASGYGIEKDLQKACYWMDIAIEDGEKWAIPEIIKILKNGDDPENYERYGKYLI